MRLSEAAEAWSAVKDATSPAALEAYIIRYKDTFYADLARARIADLKKQQVTSPPSNREQPKTLGGTLQCESSSDRPVSEFDPRCAWVDNGRRCERKSGSLATAMLEASPASKPTPEGPCAGVEAPVGNEKRCLKPKDSFKDCPECPEMVMVPAGSFMMGSPVSERDHDKDEGPQRKVTIARSIAVGKFEVTADEWDSCAAEGKCQSSGQIAGRGKHPVVHVSWNDITNDYLPWLSRKTGETYRLLTEAEWEYAARAGTTTPFSTGPTITPEQANFNGNFTYGGSAKGKNRGETVEVGSFQPNAFGLHDMYGNVWEWVEDCYKNTYSGGPIDGSAAKFGDCNLRVLRGGSWSSAEGLRSADRGRNSSDLKDNDVGFRVARTLTP
jgi:formylglycine-generating enzyme required for sulfatase activity